MDQTQDPEPSAFAERVLERLEGFAGSLESGAVPRPTPAQIRPFGAYPLDLVPAWCGLPERDHLDGMGGCWGISHGLVQSSEGAHCASCEYRRAGAAAAPAAENPGG